MAKPRMRYSVKVQQLTRDDREPVGRSVELARFFQELDATRYAEHRAAGVYGEAITIIDRWWNRPCWQKTT